MADIYAEVTAVGIQGLSGTGTNGVATWDPTLTYSQYDIVSYEGNLYYWISSTAGNSLTNPATATSEWQLSTGAGTGDGATGATGIQGASGATGVQGASGVSGGNGATGPTGASGIAGASGVAGATGAQGPAGASGVGGGGGSGATGSTGPTGASGVAGASGSQGVQGASGISGASGYVGSDGATGPQGSQGASGVSGASGSQGPTGASGVAGASGYVGSDGATGLTGATGFGLSETVFTTSSTDKVILETIDASLYRSAKYEMQISTSTSKYQATELRLLIDLPNVYLNQYGTIGDLVGSFESYYSPLSSDYSSPDINTGGMSYWNNTSVRVYTTDSNVILGLLSAEDGDVFTLNGGATSFTLDGTFSEISAGLYGATSTTSRSPLLFINRIQWTGTGDIELRFTPLYANTTLKYLRTTIAV